jgi:TRAP-type C4-dicarboxylate transport system permease small subunit
VAERDGDEQAGNPAGLHALRSVLLPVATRIDTALARTGAGAGAAILLALVVVLSLQVASRQFAFIYVPWTEEVSRLLFGWLAFLGTALAFQRNAHIAISVLVDRAPPRLRVAAAVFVRALVMTFAGIMVVYGIRLCLSTHLITTVLQLPMWLIYAAIPVSGALILFHGSVALLRLSVEGPNAREVQST